MQYNIEDVDNNYEFKNDDVIIIDNKKIFITKANEDYYQLYEIKEVLNRYTIDVYKLTRENNFDIIYERGRFYVRNHNLLNVILYIKNIIIQTKKGIYDISIKCKNLTQQEFLALQTCFESFSHKINIIYDQDE